MKGFGGLLFLLLVLLVCLAGFSFGFYFLSFFFKDLFCFFY